MSSVLATTRSAAPATRLAADANLIEQQRQFGFSRQTLQYVRKVGAGEAGRRDLRARIVTRAEQKQDEQHKHH